MKREKKGKCIMNLKLNKNRRVVRNKVNEYA